MSKISKVSRTCFIKRFNSSIREIEISCKSLSNVNNFNLVGTLSSNEIQQDEKKRGLVIIASGSGAIDRNGNSRMMTINIYNRLSDAICQNTDFSTLRYDKRGCGKSVDSNDSDLYYKAGVTDLVEDLSSWALMLKNHPSVDPNLIYIAGHSDSAIFLPQVNHH